LAHTEVWQGLAAAPGIAVGPAFIVSSGETPQTWEAGGDPGREKAALRAAVEEVRRELTAALAGAEKSLGKDEAAVFGAQLLMLDDPALIQEVSRLIDERSLGAAEAVVEVVAGLSGQLSSLPDEYIRERAADVRDVGEQLLRRLGAASAPAAAMEEPAVVVGEEIKPSLVVRLPRDKVLGLVSGSGGTTSHTALLARSLGIPAVVGLGDAVGRVRAGDVLAVDGNSGQVTLNPRAGESPRMQELQASLATKAGHQTLDDQPARTQDGERVMLGVNISGPADLLGLSPGWVDGVGLLRTEFIYMDREQEPDEEEQFQKYKEIVSFFAPVPVTIRTVDIGGDKEIPWLGRSREENPFLGLRGIRFSLHRPQAFRTQLRAVVRAAAYGKVRLMFPMVTDVREVREAKAHLAEVLAELGAVSTRAAGSLSVGIMIEVPAAALTAELLAPEVDFFSIGTNDLTQYVMAADRQNQAVAGLYQPFHPAVLRLIERVVGCAHGAGITVGVCGEMAADPAAVGLLVGLGVDELSVAAPFLAAVKERIRSIRRDRARNTAATALTLPGAAEVREYACGLLSSNA